MLAGLSRMDDEALLLLAEVDGGEVTGASMSENDSDDEDCRLTLTHRCVSLHAQTYVARSSVHACACACRASAFWSVAAAHDRRLTVLALAQEGQT